MSPDQLDRMGSLVKGKAFRWFSAPPTSTATSMSNSSYRAAVRTHINLDPSANMPKECGCGTSLRNKPSHILHCTKAPGSRVYFRHNQLRDYLFNKFQSCGGELQKEFPVGEGRRMDLVGHFPGDARTYWFDTTVGARAPALEANKRSTYGDLAARAGATLVPIAVETSDVHLKGLGRVSS